MAATAEHIGMASANERVRVAEVTEQQATMAEVARTLGPARWHE